MRINRHTTTLGTINRNRQVVIRKTVVPGNDHNQVVYVLQCIPCNHEYGANGSDLWQRRCPACDSGAKGLAYDLPEHLAARIERPPSATPRPDIAIANGGVAAVDFGTSFSVMPGEGAAANNLLQIDAYVGFDSAWTDNKKAPGAICAVWIESGRLIRFDPPRLVSFDQALEFIRSVRSNNGPTIVALDQPTLVPNAESMRPVERVAASVISWIGGGVQPANRARKGMFCDASPIWRFLADLQAVEDPEQSRVAVSGLYLMEVFPALALASLDTQFFERLSAPKYNPDRKKTFRLTDWGRVAAAAAREADALHCHDLARWCRDIGGLEKPRKEHQDMLDSALCVLIALRWRLGDRAASMMLGDRQTGYMVLPAAPAVRARLAEAAHKLAVPIDGLLR